jgi:hypothetical protein
MNAASSLLLEALLSGLKKVNNWSDEDNFIWTIKTALSGILKISVSEMLKTVLSGLI